MTATERDREVAAEIVRRGGYRVVDAIAAALAAERERALAPVRALVETFDAAGDERSGAVANLIRRATQDGERP